LNLVCRIIYLVCTSAAKLNPIAYKIPKLHNCENHIFLLPVNILMVRCFGFLGCMKQQLPCVLIVLRFLFPSINFHPDLVAWVGFKCVKVREGHSNWSGCFWSIICILFEECEISEIHGKMPVSNFHIAGFQKQTLGYSKHAKSNCLNDIINGNLQEMEIVQINIL